MKQTAVVFEAKIRSADSATHLNNTACTNSTQKGRARGMQGAGEMAMEGKKRRKRKKGDRKQVRERDGEDER